MSFDVVKLFHYLVLFNSLFFVLVFFLIRSCCSLFSLYKHSLWNLSLDSWSAWKSKQNGILVCEIWWRFEDLRNLKMVVCLCMVKTWGSWWGKKKLTSPPLDQWDPPVLSYMQLTIAPPFSDLHPPFLFSFSCILSLLLL